MRRRILSTLLLAFALVAVSVDPARADSANNIFRFGGAWVVPNGSSNYNDGTQDINFESTDGWGYFIDYERRLIPWLGIDLQVLYAQPDFEATAAGGTTTTDSVTVWNGNLGVNFHLFARSRFDLYLGAFAGWTDFDANVDAAFGYGGVLGFDIGLTKSGLALTLGVRYSQTDADVTGISGVSVSYDPLVYQLGLGWRF
jgi:outer membrane protein W